MALKLVVDTMEGLDEALHPLYVLDETDKKYHLDVAGVEDHPLVTKFKNNEQAARRSERALKAEVDKWQKLGKTDEEIQALLEKHEQDALKEAERKGEWDKLKQQMNEKHAADLKARDIAVENEKKVQEQLRAQMRRYLVDSKATQAIAAAEGEPELLLDYVKRFIKVEQDESGEFHTSIVDDKGGARVNGKGDPLTIDELLAEIKSSEKLGRAFKSSGSSGSGSQPGGGSNPKGQPPAGTPKSWQDAKSPEEKAKFLSWQKTQKATA